MTDIETLMAKLGPPAKVIPDSLHVMYGDGTKIVVPYLSRETTEKFLRREKNVVDVMQMYPGWEWEDL